MFNLITRPGVAVISNINNGLSDQAFNQGYRIAAQGTRKELESVVSRFKRVFSQKTRPLKLLSEEEFTKLLYEDIHPEDFFIYRGRKGGTPINRF